MNKEQNAAQESIRCATKYIDEAGMKIGDGLKNQDMTEAEARNKLVEYGREKQSQAGKRMSKVIGEINKVDCQLFQTGKDKKHKS